MAFIEINGHVYRGDFLGPNEIFKFDRERTYTEYCIRIGATVEQAKTYFGDVKSLEGKLPEGSFTRPVSLREERILDGFTDPDVLETYHRVLEDQMKEDLVRGYLGKEHVNFELARTRYLAILNTLKEFLPFEPKCLDISEVFRLTPTPIGGQPNKDKRHP